MKYLISVSFLFLSFCNLSAQEKHFIFIQSDNNLPFYVSLNAKLYSSSSSGYLIIPKLSDGPYKFTVGFAQNQFPEQSFESTIDKKDLGFNLKNFADKGWGLFNLQTLAITMAGSSSSGDVAKAISEQPTTKPNDEQLISFDKKKDTLVQTAAKLVEDTLTNQAAVEKEETKNISAEKDSIATGAKEAVAKDPESTGKPVADNAMQVKSGSVTLKKVSESVSEDGLHLSYVDSNGGGTDTIHIIIPSSPVTVNAEAGTSTSNASVSPTKALASGAESKANVVTDKDVKFLDIDMNAAQKDSVTKSSVATESTIPASASNCKNIATEEDYTRLRKKMAMETSDEKMINEAKKFYRNKCFTTSQIKGLSTLFLSDEGRFKFFDASYVSVADAAQYSSLQSEFIDPAFTTRFKALLQ